MAKPGLNLITQKRRKKMPARRICTRVDVLTKTEAKELRSRIGKTVKDFNKELENQDSQESEDDE